MDLLRHLRCFVAVAEELHFGRAAERLHMAQPPLSQRIRALEASVGAPLFERTSRRVSLTPAGHALLPEARAVLAGADGLRAVVELAQHGAARPVLRAALATDLSAEVVAAVHRGFRRRSSALLKLDASEPEAARRDLAAGTLHAVVLRQPARLPAGTTALTLSARLGVLLRADDPLARQGDVTPMELGDRSLVRLAGMADAEDLLATLAAYGWKPQHDGVAPDAEWARGLVLAGEAALLSERPAGLRPGLHWTPLAAPLTARCSVVVVDTGAPDVAAFVDAAREALVDVGGWHPPPSARDVAAPPPEGPLA